MKKILLLVVAATLVATSASAQLLSLGVKGGLNYAGLSNMKDIPIITSDNNVTLVGNGATSYRSKFNVGGFVGVNLLIVGVQAEFLYSRQGVENTGTVLGTNTGYTSEINLDYFNIPIMFQFYIIPKVLNFEIGPQFGFLVKSTQKTEYNVAGVDYGSGTYDINNLNETDFSIGVGLGLKIPGLPLGVNARYTFGLTDTFKDMNLNGNKKARNGVFQLTAFLKFKVI